MIELIRKKHGKACQATFLFLIFVIVCILLDYGERSSHYLLWLRVEGEFVSVFWPSNPHPISLGITLPFTMQLDTWVPLVPVTVIMVYLELMSRSLQLYPVHLKNRRIHHYHVGLFFIGVGLILITMNTGTVPFLFNGKQTNPTEFSQGLALSFVLGGTLLTILDGKDLIDRIAPIHFEKFQASAELASPK